MNANISEFKPSAPAIAPTAKFDLTPTTFAEALEFSKYLANSEFVPKNFRGKPGDCLIAMQWGSEIGLKCMQSLQNLSVINGKPGLYGDAGKAILLSAGCIIEEDDIEIIERNKKARCRITRQGRPPVERTYSVENAMTAGIWGKEGPWRTSPWRQMAWRAFWFAARDAAADLLKGMPGAEEIADMPRDMGPADVLPVIPAELLAEAEAAAAKGVQAYQKFWTDTGKENRTLLASVHDDNKTAAVAADNARTVENTTKPEAKPEVKTEPAKAETPAVTYAQVLDNMTKAKNEDALNVAADWVGEVADPEQRRELSAKYDELLARFRG